MSIAIDCKGLLDPSNPCLNYKLFGVDWFIKPQPAISNAGTFETTFSGKSM